MLGLEPKKRDSASLDKVSKHKSKKDAKEALIREKPQTVEDGNSSVAGMERRVKQETRRTQSPPSTAPKTSHIKKGQLPAISQPSPASMEYGSLEPVSLADTEFTRMLTPCSDVDFMTNPSPYATSPTSDMLALNNSQSFSFASLVADQGSTAENDWTSTQSYSVFGTFDLNGMPLNIYGDQDARDDLDHASEQQAEAQTAGTQPTTLTLSDANGSAFADLLKQENWEAQGYN
jgi:hypothetical protein